MFHGGPSSQHVYTPTHTHVLQYLPLEATTRRAPSAVRSPHHPSLILYSSYGVVLAAGCTWHEGLLGWYYCCPSNSRTDCRWAHDRAPTIGQTTKIPPVTPAGGDAMSDLVSSACCPSCLLGTSCCRHVGTTDLGSHWNLQQRVSDYPLRFWCCDEEEKEGKGLPWYGLGTYIPGVPFDPSWPCPANCWFLFLSNLL